jgi:hypothetical protein
MEWCQWFYDVIAANVLLFLKNGLRGLILLNQVVKVDLSELLYQYGKKIYITAENRQCVLYIVRWTTLDNMLSYCRLNWANHQSQSAMSVQSYRPLWLSCRSWQLFS